MCRRGTNIGYIIIPAIKYFDIVIVRPSIIKTDDRTIQNPLKKLDSPIKRLCRNRYICHFEQSDKSLTVCFC
jgi:hypothetical protein